MEIANQILEQLGQRALMMIGANTFIGDAKSLAFKIGRNSKSVTHIKITLDEASDLYQIEFLWIRGTKMVTRASHSDVYVDMLLELIETETELHTSLGTMGR